MIVVPTWEWHTLYQLSVGELYDILSLRQRVFIVEQHCPYLDADGVDVHAWHLTGREKGEIVAYLRLIPQGHRFTEPSIGRVVTHPAHRRRGIGVLLMDEGIRKSHELFPGKGIRISAQLYLREFYGRLGFSAAGDPYDEDGIPHIEMLLPPG